MSHHTEQALLQPAATMQSANHPVTSAMLPADSPSRFDPAEGTDAPPALPAPSPPQQAPSLARPQDVAALNRLLKIVSFFSMMAVDGVCGLAPGVQCILEAMDPLALTLGLWSLARGYAFSDLWTLDLDNVHNVDGLPFTAAACTASYTSPRVSGRFTSGKRSTSGRDSEDIIGDLKSATNLTTGRFECSRLPSGL